MRDLMPPPELATPVNHYRSVGLSSSIVRHVEPEDVYDDRPSHAASVSAAAGYNRPTSQEYQHSASLRQQQLDRIAAAHASYVHAVQVPQQPPRQISNMSTSTSSTVSSSGVSGVSAVSGSENWETYDDDTSEPEVDASDAYFAKVRAARAAGNGVPKQRLLQQQQQQHARGLAPVEVGHPKHQQHQQVMMVDQDGNRIASGSEWTDEDGY